MVYDEPNMDLYQHASKDAPPVDLDALREYAEQVAQINEKTPLKTALSICGMHGQNPEPKVVKHQLPVIQDEFSQIPNSNVTDVLNNPVFESQSATKKVVHLNLEDTTNVLTHSFSPYDEIQKRLENLPDEQKEKFQQLVSTDLSFALNLLTNSPTGASAITEFNPGEPTGAFLTSATQNTDKMLFNINQGPTFEVNAVTKGGQGTGQPTMKPSTRTVIAEKIQEILDMLFVSAGDEDLDYYLRHALEITQEQKVDYTTNQPRYWRYIGETRDLLGNNAVLISANGSDHKLLLCYHQRVLFMVDNKLIRLVNPESYSKTVWKYVHKCIDRHDYFWVYDKNIRRMSHKERKRILTQFYNHDNYKNGFF